MSITGREYARNHAARALTVRQPWAWLIVNALKDWENRRKCLGGPGRAFIHAGLVDDPRIDAIRREMVEQRGIVVPKDLPHGAIVGAAMFGTWKLRSKSTWCFGPGYDLSESKAFGYPTPIRGQQGFWRVPGDTVINL